MHTIPETGCKGGCGGLRPRRPGIKPPTALAIPAAVVPGGGHAPGAPALDRLRHLLSLPLWYPAGGVPPALAARRALAVPCGGLAFFVACQPCLSGSRRGAWRFWSPACPAFSFIFCPHPPDPLPLRGRGSFLVFLCKGLRPLHPRGLNPWFAAKTTGIDSLRVVPPDTCTAGSVSAAGGLMPGCRGRSPRQNKEKRAPPSPPGKGVGGIGGKSKAKGMVGRRQRRQSPPPGAWFAPGAAVGIPAIKNSANVYSSMM